MSDVLSLDGTKVVWKPHPRQAVALACPAFEMLYGGAKGGGKSDYLVMAPVHLLARAHEIYKKTGIKQERCRIVVFRKNLDNLKDLIARMKTIYPLLDPSAGGVLKMWNKQEKRFTFSSGAVLDLAHLDGPDDHLGYNGQEIRMVIIDQAEDVELAVYEFLRMQIRTTEPEYDDLIGIRVSANPGGRCDEWIKNEFIRKIKPNEIVTITVDLEDGRKFDMTRAFVPAKLKDNPSLTRSGAYEANLRRLPKHLQQMFLDGNWDVVIGAYFSHLWDPSVHVRRSTPIPGTWELKMGIDWGKTAPSAVYVAAMDPDTDTVYVIDELYQPGITGRLLGEAMEDMFAAQQWSNDKKWSKDSMYALFDWSAWHSDGEGMSPGQGIANAGFRLFDANKDRAAGIEQITERLLVRANGTPSLVIFGDRCPNLVRTMPALRGDPKKPDDIETRQEDHAFDSLRYVLMDWPVAQARRDKKDAAVERWLRMSEKAKQRQEWLEREGKIPAGYY